MRKKELDALRKRNAQFVHESENEKGWRPTYYILTEFMQLGGVWVQVIIMNGLEDSNATEGESKFLSLCS